MDGLTERQKKLAGEFQKAERSGIGEILKIYRREMDSWNNDYQKLGDLLCALESRMDDCPWGVMGDSDSVYWALADSIKVFAQHNLNDRDFWKFRECTGLLGFYD